MRAAGPGGPAALRYSCPFAIAQARFSRSSPSADLGQSHPLV